MNVCIWPEFIAYLSTQWCPRQLNNKGSKILCNSNIKKWKQLESPHKLNCGIKRKLCTKGICGILHSLFFKGSKCYYTFYPLSSFVCFPSAEKRHGIHYLFHCQKIRSVLSKFLLTSLINCQKYYFHLIIVNTLSKKVEKYLDFLFNKKTIFNHKKGRLFFNMNPSAMQMPKLKAQGNVKIIHNLSTIGVIQN